MNRRQFLLGSTAVVAVTVAGISVVTEGAKYKVTETFIGGFVDIRAFNDPNIIASANDPNAVSIAKRRPRRFLKYF